MHVFGRQLAEHLIDRYLRLYDIQTVAMLCCVFGEVVRRQKSRRGYTGEVAVAEGTSHPERKNSDRSSNVLKKTWQKMINGLCVIDSYYSQYELVKFTILFT